MHQEVLEPIPSGPGQMIECPRPIPGDSSEDAYVPDRNNESESDPKRISAMACQPDSLNVSPVTKR